MFTLSVTNNSSTSGNWAGTGTEIIAAGTTVVSHSMTGTVTIRYNNDVPDAIMMSSNDFPGLLTLQANPTSVLKHASDMSDDFVVAVYLNGAHMVTLEG